MKVAVELHEVVGEITAGWTVGEPSSLVVDTHRLQKQRDDLLTIISQVEDRVIKKRRVCLDEALEPAYPCDFKCECADEDDLVQSLSKTLSFLDCILLQTDEYQRS